jgi:hypothetical protein
VKALSPSAVIGLRDTLAGAAQAMRVRQLATPSWLSTRPKPAVERRTPPVRTVRETVVKTASSPGAATAAGSCRFFSLAFLCWCCRDTGRLRSARSESADDAPLAGSLRPRGGPPRPRAVPLSVTRRPNMRPRCPHEAGSLHDQRLPCDPQSG